MSTLRHSPFVFSFACAALLLSSCSKPAPAGDSSPSAAASPAASAPDAFPGMEADLQRTLKEQSSFYVFKTPADFERDTKGLKWEDGSELPEFADPNAKRGGTLNTYIADFPGTLRVIGPDASSSFRVYLLDYVALSFLNEHPNFPGKYYAEAAQAWAVDTAKRTVYYRIDPAARWSDGVPLTTDDVVFSFYFNRSRLLDEPWYNDYYTKTFKSVTIYDAHTFAITLPNLRPDLVLRSGISPIPKHFYKDFGPGWVEKYNWRVAPTLGAYTLRDEDIKRVTSVTLSHVENWWAENKRFMRGRYNPDRIHLAVIRDPDKAVEAFLHGDIDIAPISTQNWFTKISNDNPSVTSGFTVKAMVYNQVPPPNFGLWLNEAVAPLDNRDVRVGVAYATNMDLVCKQYFRGYAVMQKTTSDGYGWDVNPEVRPRPYDPIKAREFFAKAGYTKQGPDGVLVDAGGHRLSLTITSIYKPYQDLLVILKQEALKAGLEFNLEILDQTTGYQKEAEKRHQITLTAFGRGVEMYPRYWENFAGENAYDVPYLPDGSPNPARKVKPNTNNLSSVAIPELDRLIKLYDHAETMDQVKDLAAKIEKIIYDNVPWINGWKVPFFRVGYRPWIRWPKDFATLHNTDYEENWLMWIDEDAKKADMAIHDSGGKLPVQVLTFDKYKEP
jgi:microcin C transport system substrate-binding protein